MKLLKEAEVKIQIIFENGTVFDWHMYDNDFVNRWFEMFKSHCRDVPDKHNYEITTSGINDTNEFDLLLDILYKINEHRSDTIPKKYFKKIFTLSELSELHYIYEKIGNDNSWLEGNFSKNKAIKYRDLLNDYIHQSESKAGLKTVTPRVRFRIVDPKSNVPNARKEDFHETDYKLFQPIIYPYTMYLNYNAVGEDYIKTFKSGRPANTAVPLRKYSPSFFFVFNSIDYNIQKRRIEECKKWMTSEGVNISDPKNSFGYIPLGTLFKTEDDSCYKTALVESKISKVVFNY